ncbi:MAG: hypothetical protein J2P57_00395, partial [Acidimicrobiaceae bacterium]|nr:hypothetical protein [Acidimicrobiaceae bacterium]
RWPVLLAGLAVAGGFFLADVLGRRAAAALLVAATVTLNIGPAAYTLQTIGSPHTGSIVTAGPYRPGIGGGPGGGTAPRMTGQPPTGLQMPGQQMPGQRTQGQQMRGGPGGGVLGGSQVDDDLKTLLEQGADGYRWVAATVGAQGAASYELATGGSVMAIGGFNGTTPSITLAQFETYVAEGRIHYFIAGGGMGGGMRGGTSSDASQISAWVEQSFTATTVGGSTVYDLTQPASGTGSSA